MRVIRLIGQQAALVIRRPAGLRTVIMHHAPALALVGAAIVLPLFVSLMPFPLHSCMFLRITGYPCPTCGGTRAFIDCLGGDWLAAFRQFPLAVPLYFVTWAFVLWNLAALISRRSVCVVAHRSFKKLAFQWGLRLGTVLLLANWIYRLALGLK